MRFFRYAVAALSLSLMALTSGASPATPQNGVDYRTLDKAQPTDSGKKIEVTEFFWYACPHCHALDPALENWVKKQGEVISFKRVPVLFRDSMLPQQKMFYALESLGKLEELHKKIFQAIHVERQPLDNENAIAEFMAKQGIDKQKFLEAYHSFGVQSKVRRAAQLQNAYQIDGVPLIAIDGRFLTSPSIIGASMGNQPEPVLHKATLQVMDWLVAKALKEQKGPATEDKSSAATKAGTGSAAASTKQGK